MDLINSFQWLDVIALSVFFISWSGHYYIVNHSRLQRLTITAAMSQRREQWMLKIIEREGASPVDALIQNGLQQGVLFFGSTTVLLIGALAAGLGASTDGVAVLKDLPMSTTDSVLQWEVKLFLIMFIFVFAFFKFAWSHRLHNYILVMIGGAPGAEVPQIERREYARKLALLHALAAKHFTTGLNSYFFALAASAWLINAMVFIAATLWVSLVLYRRAFRSEFMRLLNANHKDVS